MSDEPKKEKPGVNVEVDLTSAIIVLFMIFWWQSGWYRIDCALGTQRACDLIAAEYVKKEKP